MSGCRRCGSSSRPCCASGRCARPCPTSLDDMLRVRTKMLRNRTTVKVQPGLFLQPYIVSQLSGAVVVAVVEGSEVTATEYALTSWLPIVGSATPTELARVL